MFVSAFPEFVDDVPHLLRAEELRLFDVDHRTCFSHGPNQIGLTGQKGGQLNDVGHLGGDCGLLRAVDIRDHRDAVGVFHRLEDLQSLLEPGAPEGVNRRAVGLVVGRLEDKRDVQSLADILVVLRATQGEVQILEDVDPAQEGEGPVVGDGEVTELDLSHHDLEVPPISREPTRPDSAHWMANSTACWVTSA